MTYGSLRLVNGRWEIHDLVPHVAIRMKRWFPAIRASETILTLTSSPENNSELLWLLERYPMEMTAADERHLSKLAKDHAKTQRSIQDFLTGRRTPARIRLAIPARDYQAMASELCYTTGRLLCADELGTGKTVTAISLLARDGCFPAVVVCPLNLLDQWHAQLLKFLPTIKAYTVRSAPPLRGTPRGEKKLAEVTAADVVIIGYSRLSQWAESGVIHPNTVVFDECHELRHTGTARYIGAIHMCTSAKWRMGLSATPIYNRGDEFFAVNGVLAPGELGTHEEFLREWCGAQNQRGQANVKDPPALGSWLRERGLMLHRTRRDIGRELPPIVRSLVEIPIDHLGRDHQDQKGVLIDLAWRALYGVRSAFTARGELNIKLRHWTGTAKAAAVASFVSEIVESTGEPIILAGWHYDVYDIWQKQLAHLHPVMYTGRETLKEKQQAVADFVDGRSKIMIMSLRAGLGIDGLQGTCHRVAYGEIDYSPQVHHQLTGRVHRDGQGEPVMEYWLVADEGSDPIILDVLGLKRWQSDGVIDPGGERLLNVKIDPDHVKKLAADFLRRNGLDPMKPPPDLDDGDGVEEESSQCLDVAG